MNGLLAGAWLIINFANASQTATIPYASMYQCHTAEQQFLKQDDNKKDQTYCVLGSNPMYGDIPKQPIKKKN